MSATDSEPPAGTNPGEGQTEEYPTLAGAITAPPEQSAAETPLDDDDEWAVKGPARGIRLSAPVAGLLALLLAGGGFWGGAALQKSHGASTGGGAAGFAARFRGLRAAGGGAGGGGFNFGGAAASSGTSGTISVVAGKTLYILSAAGALVKVTLTPSTTITRDAGAKPIDLRPGDTVVVQGAAGANGVVAASSIAATAPGVSSTAAGGLGLGAGAAAAGSTTTGG